MLKEGLVPASASSKENGRKKLLLPVQYFNVANLTLVKGSARESVRGLLGSHLPRHPRGAEDQDERQPGADKTAEHVKALIYGKGNQEKINDNNKGDENSRRGKGTGVIEFPEIDDREDNEIDWRPYSVDDQGDLDGGQGHADTHGRPARSPANKGKHQNDEDFPYSQSKHF